ncbi:MAG TPA: hypothetical protein VE981_00355 [Planctomycetota bacterium]|nr:hypothetical protein [Planctomycetota bacterium]
MDRSSSDGGPAFPGAAGPGMTILDYFAIQLASGICASDLRPPHHDIPHMAYELAAEMVKESRKRAGNP